MRLLLDTHILLWWMVGDRRLPKTVATALAAPENDIAVSAASLWEIAIKQALGRIDIDLDDLVASIAADGFSELAVRFPHTLKLQSLPGHHSDPFDRLLIAQAIAEGRRLVTTDAAVLAYRGVPGFDPLSS